MSKPLRDSLSVKWLLCIAWGALLPGWASLYGQPQDLKNIGLHDQAAYAGSIVIGKLIGHDHYQKLRIRLSEGEFLIHNSSNSAPFRVITFSPRRIEIDLQPHVLADQTDPRALLIQFFPDELQLMTALILERVDYAVFRTREQASEVTRANENVVVIPMKTLPNTVEMLLYNVQHAVLSSPAVRRAMAYAINKRKIVEELLQNDGLIARGSPYESDRPFFLRGLDEYKYDPGRALEILHGNGWRDVDGDGVLERGDQKLSFQLAFERGVLLEEQVARRIQLDLFEVGIEIIPVSYTRVELDQKLETGAFETTLLENRFEETLEALYTFFADRRRGYIGFRNRNFDLLYREYRRERPNADVKTYAQRMQAILNRQAVACFLFFRYYDYHLFNIRRVGNFYDEKRAEIKPFDQWILRQPSK